ncbi:MAG: FAD-binding oxidoreductase [Gemmatimonadaceae bacterium]|nr:FAD-binding oxidoreductase [Gemmatimonadaceae bacterium]
MTEQRTVVRDLVYERRRVTSWGHTRYGEGQVFTARTADHVAEIFGSLKGSTIVARGLGRSYGDCCINDGAAMVDMVSHDRVLEIDGRQGRVVCEAGVSLRQLASIAHHHGWRLPVYPGTGFVTVGGAIANDIHGKEQHVAGTFGHHVLWIDLLTPDGLIRRVSTADDAELFAATVGGVGLTGIILRAAIQLAAVESHAIRVEERRCSDIESIASALESGASRYPSMVAWLDLMSEGPGRGILEFAEPVDSPVSDVRLRGTIDLPFRFPEFAINGISMRVFNALVYHRIASGGRVRVLHRNQLVFPLDALGEWHRAYGKRGLFQFQCCVPTVGAVSTFMQMRDELVRAGIGSTLAVMKWVGKRGAGTLSFTRPGLSLAMDFPGGSATVALIHRLQQLVVRAQGTVYLAKDACLRPEEYRTMYEEAGEFARLLERVDPQRLMQSDMSRRLTMHEG